MFFLFNPPTFDTLAVTPAGVTIFFLRAAVENQARKAQTVFFIHAKNADFELSFLDDS